MRFVELLESSAIKTFDDWHAALKLATNDNYEVSQSSTPRMYDAYYNGSTLIGSWDGNKKEGTVNNLTTHNPKQTTSKYNNIITQAKKWIEMYDSNNSAESILADPLHQQWTDVPNTAYIYRAIIINNKKLNSIKAGGPVIAYATDKAGCMEFLRSVGVSNEKWVIVEKQLKPADFLLDFSAMYEELELDSSSRYETEYEVWMKPTSYYTKFSKAEVVFTSEQDADGEQY
jgi:hypothetical protein